jgi:hypothetical protein
MQLRWSSVTLDFLKHVLCYLVALVLGVAYAALFSFVAYGNVYYLASSYLLFDFLLITLSLILIALVVAKLRVNASLTPKIMLYAVLSFVSSFLVSAQAFFVMSVLFSANFLYECYPFCLRRISIFSSIKISLNTAVIFLLALLTVWGFVGVYPVLVFFAFYGFVAITEELFRYYTHNREKRWQMLLKVTLCFLILIFCLAMYSYGWAIIAFTIKKQAVTRELWQKLLSTPLFL